MGFHDNGGMAFSGRTALVLVLAFFGPAPHAAAARLDGVETRWMPWKHWTVAEAGHKAVYFPVGDLFAPPMADQKQPRFFASWQSHRSGIGDYSVASVGFGENIGLVRWPGRREGEGWQLGLSGAVFAIFNMDAVSHDLLNADYVVGFPLSFRRGRWSWRARLFHQSSHLGDEFLLESQPVAITRLNLSYEALEALFAWDNGAFRVYGGSSRILSTVTPLKRQSVQAGLEYIGGAGRRKFAALEWSAWEETAWRGGLSVKAGLRIASRYEVRSLWLYGEYFSGQIPHGQFFELYSRYFGVGLAFSL